jgi:hypothetical protein
MGAFVNSDGGFYPARKLLPKTAPAAPVRNPRSSESSREIQRDSSMSCMTHVIGHPAGQQGIEFANARHDMWEAVKRGNDFLHLGRNLGMVFHVRLADLAIDNQEHGFAHDGFFVLEMFEDEGKHVAEQADQIALALDTLLWPQPRQLAWASWSIHTRCRSGDGGNQETMLEIDQLVTGDQLRRQLAGLPPMRNHVGQRVNGNPSCPWLGNHPLSGHRYSESSKGNYSTATANLSAH